MKIRILASATHDLTNDYGFGEEPSPGIETCCLDTLFWDIDSLIEHIPPV